VVNGGLSVKGLARTNLKDTEEEQQGDRYPVSLTIRVADLKVQLQNTRIQLHVVK